MGRHRAWCITVNNYNIEDINMIKGMIYKYLIIGDEKGEKETPHLQCYINLCNPKSFKAMKTAIPRGHIEIARGSAEDNRKYCSKEKILFEDGEMPKQGKRNDIGQIRDLLNEGKNMTDIVEIARSCQSVRFAEKWLTYKEEKRNWKTTVIWIYGNTGVGKTRKAFELSKDEEPWISNGDLTWWDGYDKHKNVILDDFRGDHCNFANLLRILDRYPLRVPIKGGFRQLLAKQIIITCPMSPKQMYEFAGENVGQLLRRIDKVIHL